MIKKIVGQLKVTSNNIFDYLLYKQNSKTGEQYKNFNVEITAVPLSRTKFYKLCEMSDSDDESIKQKRGNLVKKISVDIVKKMAKEYNEDSMLYDMNVPAGERDKIFEKRLEEIDLENKKEKRAKGLLLQGYTRINDCFFYTIGVSHGYGYYKFFAFNGGERLAITITGKDFDVSGKLKRNAILSKFSINENEFNEDFVCGIGALQEIDKDESPYFVEKNIFETRRPLSFITSNFKTLKTLFNSDDFFLTSYDTIEESIQSNSYKVYEVKEKVNILPIIKKYSKKINEELLRKYGKCYASQITYEDELTGKKEDICADFLKIVGNNLDEIMKNFPTKLNNDAKNLVKESIGDIFANCNFSYEDINVSYICEMIENYDLYSYVCKEDVYKMYATTLFEHLKGAELTVKDVLSAYKDAEAYLTFSSEEENVKNQIEMDETLEEEGFYVAFCKAKRVNFLIDRLKDLKFREDQIRNLVVDFYVFECLQDDVVEEFEFTDLKKGGKLRNEDYIIKSSEYVYKKTMTECSKAIVGKMKKEQRENFKNEHSTVEQENINLIS